MTGPSTTPPQPHRPEGDLDVFSIQAQGEELRSWMTGRTGPQILDLSGIQDLDLSGLQLLLALGRQATEQGVSLVLVGTQPEWVERFRPLGLAGLLEGRP